MPIATAQVSKQTLRRAVAGPGGYRTRSTTGTGTATTAIIAALSGIGADYVLDMPWGLANDGNNAGEFRRASSFSGTTVTFADGFTNAVANSVSMDFYPYLPTLYTEAANRAMRKLYQRDKAYRLVNSHIIPHSERKLDGSGYYALPRNMDRVHQLSVLGSLALRDLFDRADSTTEPGNSWVETAGNWGIISERLYAQSDANGDHVTRDLDLKDGVIQAIVRGTLNSATTYRTPALTFRIAEDRNGAIDTTNYLAVRLLNAVVDLRKVDSSTESSLTTATQTTTDGTDYLLRVQFRGTHIMIWVDDVLLIDYNLTGLNEKYTEYPRAGIRWDTAGSPATAARVDDYYAFHAEGLTIWPDWRQSGDNNILEIPAFGDRAPTGILYVEGGTILTTLTADNVASLDADGTARVEIETTDRAYETLIEQARAELYLMLGEQVYPTGLSQNSEQYLRIAQQHAENARQMLGMTSPSPQIRGAWTY